MFDAAQKGTIKLTCTEQAFPEFPNLLFGTQIESGVSYFDATLYLQKDSQKKYIKDFFNSYGTQIESLCTSYDISPNEVYKINEKGHYLIDGNFVYLFISFVEPNFLGYVCDRIHELFKDGIAVSDTYLLNQTVNRFNMEVLKKIYRDASNSK